MYTYIGISGVARSGKDLFYKLLRNSLDKNYNVLRYSLADRLKDELRDYIKDEFNVDILNCTPEEKERTRPFVSFYANFKRFETNGTYWIDRLEERIFDDILSLPSKSLFCITDVRYPNEIDWLHKKNGYLVHIEKLINGKPLEPVDFNERRYDPVMKANADFKISWPAINSDNYSPLIPYIEQFSHFFEIN